MADVVSILKNLLRHGPSGLLFATSRELHRAAVALDRGPALSQDDKRLLARNAQFENKYEGQRAFVIGNGPSLNRQDLDRLIGERIFVVNSFWKHPLMQQWQPDAFCLADPAWFDPTGGMEDNIDAMLEVITEAPFFFPLKAAQAVRERGLFPLDRSFYVGFRRAMWDTPNFSFDLTGPIPAGRSVSPLAIMVALYMGCNPVYLIGMDHDGLAYSTEVKHFYDTADSTVVRQWPAYDFRVQTVLWLWRGYRHLQHVAESHGRRILNATDGGFLDVFERVDYDSLFD